MEITILNWINDNLHGSYAVNQIFKYITYLGAVWFVLGIIFLFAHTTRFVGVMLIIAFITSLVASEYILKSIIEVPRPYLINTSIFQFLINNGIHPPTSSSFPSVHTATSFSSATIIAHYLKNGKWAYLPAVIISFSRIFLCLHYVSDIIGGAFIGVVMALLLIFLVNIFIKYIVLNINKSKGT